MAFYAFFVELLYYGYHRCVHKQPFYKLIHSIHHKSINTYPIDFLNSSIIDSIFYMMCLHIPTYIIPMNIGEYFIGVYFFTTMGFITHSDILSTTHVIHHRSIACNYCIFFPIFDYYFNTFRVPESKVLQIISFNLEKGLIYLQLHYSAICQNEYYDHLYTMVSKYNKEFKCKLDIDEPDNNVIDDSDDKLIDDSDDTVIDDSDEPDDRVIDEPEKKVYLDDDKKDYIILDN